MSSDMLRIDVELVEKKLTKFIKSEFRKKGFKKAVFGLSGGVDSSLVAFLLKKSLVSKNVLGISMPYTTTDKKSKENVKEVVKQLGIKFREIPITPMVEAYFKYFPKADKVRRGNKMARERMSVLYDQSKVENALVVGSGNKTEILLGYATLFGDTACAINPIGCLYKTQVRQLAQHMGIPSRIIWQTPSAGLWPGQTDEAELGLSYEKMDEILYLVIDKGYRPSQLIKRGFSKDSIKRLLDRIEKFRYKRELPVIAQLR